MKIGNFVLVGFLPIILAGCRHDLKARPEDDASIMVKTAKVDTATYAQPINITGIITSDVESRLSFKTGGIIRKMYVKEGDKVKKGQLIATLDPTEIDAQLQSTKNRLDKTERDFHRIENLYKDSTATTEEYENSQTALNTDQQAYTIARFNRDNSAIYANQSGTVIQKLVNEGENIAPGSPVYIINSTDNRDWVIRLGLSDKDWAKVRLGDEAVVGTDAYPDHPFNATIIAISNGADPANGTFLTKLKIDPGTVKLANGLAAKVRILPSRKEPFKFIPVDALVEADQNSASVFTIDADGRHVTKHQVRVKFTEDSRVAVYAGLEGIGRVITDGSAYLTSKSVVKLTENQNP
jgi:RND family efflux transporter MFP subunit